MDTRSILILVLSCLLFTSMGVIAFLYYQGSTRAIEIPIPDTLVNLPGPEPLQDSSEQTWDTVDIYFPRADHATLVRQRIQIPTPQSLEERIRRVVEELIRGTSSRDLANPLPEDTELLSLFWLERENRVVASFNEAILNQFAGHAQAEWATIYSVVNSIAGQSAAIREVQILVAGQPIDPMYTLWDWSLPFTPETELFVQRAP